jgi:N-acetylated-alpha-linked acidic dipeptidase
LIADGLYALATDPQETFIIPQPEENVPHFNFAPVQNAMEILDLQAKNYQTALQTADNNVEHLQELNALLKDMERTLLREHGLPQRPWYKHHIYAPGFYTGYGVKTLPGAREAIEQRKFDQVNHQIEIIADVLIDFSAQIEKAVQMME